MDTGSALAVVAAVIALASAILTWQVGRRTLRITTYSGATELTLAIGEKMIANPELRQYFYDRRPLQPEVTGRDRSLVLATGMYILDVLECIWDHRREYERDDRESWGRYIHDCLQAPVLRDLYEEMRTMKLTDAPFNILSMGMSNDYEVAISEGANVVRVGSAIFGESKGVEREEQPEEEE